MAEMARIIDSIATPPPPYPAHSDGSLNHTTCPTNHKLNPPKRIKGTKQGSTQQISAFLKTLLMYGWLGRSSEGEGVGGRFTTAVSCMLCQKLRGLSILTQMANE